MSSSDTHTRTALCLASLALLALAGCSSAPVRPSVPPQVEARQYLNSGMQAAQNGQHELALSEYVKGLGADQKNVELHYRAAVSQMALGKLSTAGVTYQRVLALQPNHAGALEGLGLLMLKQTQHAAAKQLLEQAVAQNAGAWRSLNGLGTMADLQRNHVVAQDYYGRALLANPNSAMLINNLGYSKYLAGRYEEASTHFERAIAIDPQYAQAWSNLGLVLARKGKLQEAVRAFGQSMPEAEATYTTGYVCLLDNRLGDAESMFRRAIDLSPSYYSEAQDGLAKVKVMRGDLARSSRRR